MACFRFHPSRPNAPRPVAKSGSAAGNGVGVGVGVIERPSGSVRNNDISPDGITPPVGTDGSFEVLKIIKAPLVVNENV